MTGRMVVIMIHRETDFGSLQAEPHFLTSTTEKAEAYLAKLAKLHGERYDAGLLNTLYVRNDDGDDAWYTIEYVNVLEDGE